MKNYKPIGNYIQPVDERNTDLQAKDLLGINIDKFFMPSVANVVGTDLSKYKLVGKNQFACNLMHVGRDERIPISMSDRDEPFMVSPAYEVFEIKDTGVLLPEYAMMWFRRAEYDRYAWFQTDADVRGGLPWKSFLEMQIPIPPISRQCEIVAQYNTIQNRINQNNALIARLEQTAQAIYKEWFVDGVDRENLPEGWRVDNFETIMEITSGKNPQSKSNDKNGIYKYPIYGAGGVMGYSSDSLFNEKLLSMGRVGTHGIIQRINFPSYPSDNTLVLKSDYYEYVYQILININYDEINRGGVQGLITQTDIKALLIIIPPNDLLKDFENRISNIFALQELKSQESQKLEQLKRLLLSRMASIEKNSTFAVENNRVFTGINTNIETI